MSSGRLLDILQSWSEIAEPGRSRYEWKNEGAFAAIKDDGSLISWGVVNDGDSPSVFRYDGKPIQQIYSNRHSFVAVDAAGKVIVWGSGDSSTDLSGIKDALSSDIVDVFSSRRAFAALNNDGSLYTWGRPDEGGDSSSVAEHLRSGVVRVFSSGTSMAALKEDGSVWTWGLRTSDPRSEDKGGSIDTGSPRGGDSSAVAEQISSGVEEVYTNRYAMAAIKQGGQVVAWGDPLRGGETGDAQRFLDRNVVSIYSTGTSFAALKKNGKVVTWGDRLRGGAELITDDDLYHWDLTAEENKNATGFSVEDYLQKNVVKIFSTRYAYAAVKDNGKVVTWGSSLAGGDSSAVQDKLDGKIIAITPTRYSFAALRNDGSIVTWGEQQSMPKDKATIRELDEGGFVSIASNRYAFAALSAEGSVLSWGLTGPNPGKLEPIDTSAVADQLQSDVVQLYSTEYAFAALKKDGSVVAWGEPTHGGDISAIEDELSGGVVSLATPYSDLSMFKIVDDTVISMISVDLEKDFFPVHNVNLAGIGSPSAKGNANANRLNGNAQNNLLSGRAGLDVLIGGLGDDQLAGGSGADRLIGGSGADLFVMSTGHDKVMDFNPEDGDQVWFAGSSAPEIASVEGGLLLSLPGRPEDTLTLFGVNLLASDSSQWLVST